MRWGIKIHNLAQSPQTRYFVTRIIFLFDQTKWDYNYPLLTYFIYLIDKMSLIILLERYFLTMINAR